MGSTYAAGLVDAVTEGITDLTTALSIHLSSNHYPPIPQSMVPVAQKAIEKANAGEWDVDIELPEGVTHRIYGKQVPARVVVEALHLDTFLESGEE